MAGKVDADPFEALQLDLLRSPPPTGADGLTDEEIAAFGTGGCRVPMPDPCPYMKFEAPDGRPGVEIGVKGTF